MIESLFSPNSSKDELSFTDKYSYAVAAAMRIWMVELFFPFKGHQGKMRSLLCLLQGILTGAVKKDQPMAAPILRLRP